MIHGRDPRDHVVAALARVPPWSWVLIVLLLVVVCSACAPKKPPQVFASPPPELPAPSEVELVDVDDEVHVDGEIPCEIASVHPGEEMPGATLGKVNGSGPVVPVASCAGHLVPSIVLAQWTEYPDLVDVWQASAERQHLEVAERTARCQAVYDAEWTYGTECAKDRRALQLAVPAALAGGTLFGGLIVYGLFALAEAVAP